MNSQLVLVLLLLAAAIAMFVANRPRMDAVALLMIVVMPFTGVITVNEALAGFSDPNIVLIAALFVIGEGLVRTGVARRLGDWLNAHGGDSETKLLVLLMLAVGGLGALMSSTAVVAIFIPVVMRICQNTGTAPSQLMMPLSFAALISGMLTLVATAPNLVVNAELMRQGDAGLGFFSFTPFGLPLLLIGTAYMVVARRWLPRAKPGADDVRQRPTLREWVERYGLAERTHRVRVRDGSPLAGVRLGDVRARDPGASVLAIERGEGRSATLLPPAGQTIVAVGDVLMLDVVAPETIGALSAREALDILAIGDGAEAYADRSQELGMVEAIVPAGSDLVGETPTEARTRRHYGLTAIGLRHSGAVPGADLTGATVRAGDTLLLAGFWTDVQRLREEGANLVALNVPAEFDEVLPAASKAPHALFSLAVVVVLMVSGLVPNVHAALIGCLMMGLFGCVDMASGYRSISWKSIVLIVGMLPFSIALQRTGGVALAADALVAAVGQSSPHVVLASLFVITAILGLFISNTATAVLMAPVALAIGRDLHASPYPFAMIVALAASSAFMTPISSPVNTLVVGPGNYGFGDFVKIGVPFTVIVLIVSVIMVPWLLPL